MKDPPRRGQPLSRKNNLQCPKLIVFRDNNTFLDRGTVSLEIIFYSVRFI